MTATRVDDLPTWYAPPPSTPAALPPHIRPSGWFRRVNATLVDAVVGYALTLVLGAPVLTLAAAEVVPTWLAVVVFYVASLVVQIANQVLQGRTGATVGKHLLGLRVVDEWTFEHIRTGSSIARPFVHLIDAIPLYLGFLAPIVDGRRRTFTDMAMGTLVVRAPRARPGAVTGVVATSLTGVLLAASVALLTMADPLVDTLEASGPVAGSATGAAAAPAAESRGPLLLEPLTPPEPPPGGPLPAGDLAGRVMPPLPGFTQAPEHTMGEYTLERIADENAATPEEAGTITENLRSWGLLRGYGRAFDRPELAYTVLVYEVSSPQAAAEYVRDGWTDVELVDVALADSVAFAPEENGTAQRGLFAHGPHVFEVAVFTDGSPVQLEHLRAVMLAQQTYARVVG